MRKDLIGALFMIKKSETKVNYSSIARKYNCDSRTVKKYYLKKDNDIGIRKPRVIKKLTDGFESIIYEKCIKECAPTIAVFKVLKDNYGYKGSYSTLKYYVKNLKSEESKKATLRFETNPGCQCQIDYKERLTLKTKDDKEITINIFLAILGYSRYKYIELSLDKSQPSLFRCLTKKYK